MWLCSANKRAMGKAVRRQVRREALTAKRAAATEKEAVEELEVRPSTASFLPAAPAVEANQP